MSSQWRSINGMVVRSPWVQFRDEFCVAGWLMSISEKHKSRPTEKYRCNIDAQSGCECKAMRLRRSLWGAESRSNRSKYDTSRLLRISACNSLSEFLRFWECGEDASLRQDRNRTSLLLVSNPKQMQRTEEEHAVLSFLTTAYRFFQLKFTFDIVAVFRI